MRNNNNMLQREKEREQNKIYPLEINESFLKRIRPCVNYTYNFPTDIIYK